MKASRYDKCKFGPCEGSVTNSGTFGLCNRHANELNFIMWVLENIQIATPEKAPQDTSTIKIK